MNKARLAALALALVAGAAAAGSADAADAKRGRELFATVGCWGCHGYNGQGGNAGPKLAPDPLPLEAMIAFVRQADKSLMPPYAAKSVSDADMADIHAWLSAQPKAPDWQKIPALAR